MEVEIEISNKVKETVLSIDKDAQVILFGSRARGDHRKDSDWDMLILTNRKVDGKFKREIRDQVYKVALEYMQPISTIIIENQNWQSMALTTFYQNIAIDGKFL